MSFIILSAESQEFKSFSYNKTECREERLQKLQTRKIHECYEILLSGLHMPLVYSKNLKLG
jgi:hypothetical protein